MSKQALAQIVQRAISDGAFRRQLSTDPATALRGFDLSPDETAALRSGDAGKLSALGVDVRMSKVFAFGTGDPISGEGAHQSDLGASYTAAVASDATASAVSSALVSSDVSPDNAMIDAGFLSSRVSPDSPLGATAAQTGGEGGGLVQGADIDDGMAGLQAADIDIDHDSSALLASDSGTDIDHDSSALLASDSGSGAGSESVYPDLHELSTGGQADAIDPAGGGSVGDAAGGPDIQP